MDSIPNPLAKGDIKMKVIYTVWKQGKSRVESTSAYKNLKQWIIYTPLLAIAFSGWSCGGDEEVTSPEPPPPEVHLVKDSDTEFHLQWRERLQVNRTVLVHLEIPDNKTGYDYVSPIVPKDTLQSESVTLPRQIGDFSKVTNISVERIRFIDNNGAERFILNPSSKLLPNGHTWEIIREDADSFHIALTPPLYWQDAPLYNTLYYTFKIEYFTVEVEEVEMLLYFPVKTVRSEVYSGYSRVLLLPANSREFVNLPAEARNATTNGTTTVYQFYRYTVGKPDELIFE